MWLLDANVPIALREVLTELSVKAETTEFRGWKHLKNGELVKTAYAAGIRCIVTQDEDFRKLATKYTGLFPDLAIVWLKLPQARWKIYRENFVRAWQESPIRPTPGKMVEWPSRILVD